MNRGLPGMKFPGCPVPVDKLKSTGTIAGYCQKTTGKERDPMSLLLKYYVQKVMTKITTPANRKPDPKPVGKKKE